MVNLTALGVTLISVGSFNDVARYPMDLTLYVYEQPLIENCSLIPDDPNAPLVVLESKFNFQCSPPSVGEDLIKYNVYCGSESSSDYELYSDFYPDATDIIIPVTSCDVFVKLENAYKMSSTEMIGKYVQKSPVDIIVPDNNTAPNTTLTEIEKEMENINSVVNETSPELIGIKKTIILSTAAERIDILLKNDSTPELQERSSEVLTSVSETLLNMTDEPSSPLLETYFQDSSKRILSVADHLMVLQNQSNATGDGFNHRVITQIQITVSTVAEAVLERANVGELINISTPNIEMKVWKSESINIAGKKIKLKDMELEMPESIGEGVISLSAVSTIMNPIPEAFLEYATNFINVSLEGTGVEKEDFPLVYSFPRNTKIIDDENSPNRITFELSGEVHCVRYDSAKRLYGWRVLSNSATMSIEIPAGGRGLITVATNASLYIESGVYTVNLEINNETVGTLCWPVVDVVTFSNIKITKSISDENEDELWIENARNVKTRVGLNFLISYTKLMSANPPQKCNAALARKGTLTYPVSSSVKLFQMLGQCLVYSETTKKFVYDKRCTAFPEKNSVRCECTGSSVRTAVDAPVTNNIDFSEITIDLQDNPVPFIFSVSTACLFLLLCFLGALRDIRSKRKLAPLIDPKKVGQPIKYNVFIYISKFRHPRGKKITKFSLTLRGRIGVSVTNTYISPGVSHGGMLHLVHHSDELLGSIRKVVLIPQDKSIKWHVSRVVVSDAVEQELAVFFFDCWLAGEARSKNRSSEMERNCWRENFFAKAMSDVMEGIPVLMLLLPGGIQDRKLDHMLTYSLGLMVWAVLQLWFYEAVHPLFRPDDCIKSSRSTSQIALNSIVRMLLNLILIIVSTLLVEGTIRQSLMYKEKKSKESRNFRAKGFLPLPHWFRLVVRGFATMVMVTTISFLTLMSYMFSKTEFNIWLVNMGEAFAFQIASKSLEKVVKCAARYLLYLPNPHKFNEAMVNPEGMRVMCPVCHVCPQVLHKHFRSHINLTDVQRPRHWFIDSSSSSWFKDAYLFPV